MERSTCFRLRVECSDFLGSAYLGSANAFNFDLTRRVVDDWVLVNQVPPELGEVIIGNRAARQSEADITFCDLTGTGAQDTAIANLALQRTLERGAGTAFPR